MSATQALYQTRFELPLIIRQGQCAMCNGPLHGDTPVKKAIGSTFTNLDALGTGEYICTPCMWFASGKNTELQAMLQRDKPQKPANYTHILANGEWHIYSKSHNHHIAAHLLQVIPEVCIIAQSGQKQLAFRGRVNPPGQRVGWIMFEEDHIWLDSVQFAHVHNSVSALYAAKHTKSAIRTGHYNFYSDTDLILWRQHEAVIAPLRGAPLLELSIHLAKNVEE